MSGARHVGLAIEATWGSAESTMDLWLELLSEGVQLEPKYYEAKTVRTRATRGLVLLSDIVRGPLSALVNYQDIAHLADWFLGSTLTSGTGPYTHTAPHTTTGLADRPGLTVEIQRDEGGDGETWRYAGNVLTSLGLNINLEQPLSAELALVGKSEATGSADTASYPDFDLVYPSHATVNFDGSPLDARSFSVQLNWPVDEPGKLGATALAKKPADSDVLAVSGNCEVYFDSMTQYNKFSGHSDVDVQLDCDSGGDEQLTINLDVCKLLQGTPHVDGRNRLVCPFQFQATYDGTALSNVQVVTINDVSAMPT